MVKYYSARYILPVSSGPIPDGVVSVASDGSITGLYQNDDPGLQGKIVEKHEGVIVPGFINSHCHLELSHMIHKLPEQTGLVEFIKSIISQRQADEGAVKDSMQQADEQMYTDGIVAVGDISNNNLSARIKENSKIYYHTFIELLGFAPDKAKDIFNSGVKLKDDFGGLKSSISPHAPYSVSKELFKLIRKHCDEQDNLYTIHNQECEDENRFFRYKKGRLVEFFESIGQNIDHFKAQARNSIQTIVPYLPDNQKVLLVHNIYTSLKDMYFIKRFNRDVHWCFCPRANMYIENRMPKIDMFLSHNFNITLGTDSLASNKGLSILEELKALQLKFPSFSLIKTIPWATLNGAVFLGIDKQFGSIEIGKKPGLNLITCADNLTLTAESAVKKLI